MHPTSTEAMGDIADTGLAQIPTSFITWYPSCRRSDALAKALGGNSHLIHRMKFKQPIYAPLKYLLQAVATFRQLRRDQPHLILVASPPVVAVLCVWLYCRIAGARYIIDAHTGVFDDHRWTWLLPLTRALSRQAVATIVTNSHLQKQVESWNARALVIGDVPIDFAKVPATELGPGKHVAVVNTFSQDEPLDNIVAAARMVPNVSFHITGDPTHSRSSWSDSLPPNARFTGWLTDDEYVALLSAVDVVMCLTTNDHTMQRGAYEAMALEKPVITSSWDVLRETFYDGTIHVANKPDDIAAAILRALAESPELARGMSRLRRERRRIFAGCLQRLRAVFLHECPVR